MAIPGTVTVTGIIAPTVTGDTYPVTDAIYGMDGLRNVGSTQKRNAIPNDRRRAGMVVGVDSTATTDTTIYWSLLPEPWNGTDSDWAPFPSGINTGYGTYYVDKKYVGVGAAIVTGLTYSSITSTNQSYLNQFNSARVGNPSYSFPCPFSARNRALDDISAGKISMASIIVLGGQWTVGSDDPLKNGNISGTSINSNVTADVGFSVANNTTVASIAQNNLAYWFAPNTRLTYINTSYTMYNMYHVDTSDLNPFNFNLKGHLDLVFIYGKKNPDSGVTYYNYYGWFDNGLSNINLEYNSIIDTQSFGFRVRNIKTFNLKIVLSECTDGKFVTFNPSRKFVASGVSFNLEVDTLNRFKNIDIDWWDMINFQPQGNIDYGFPNLNVNVNIKNSTTSTGHDLYDPMYGLVGTIPYDSRFNFNIGNLVTRIPAKLNLMNGIFSFTYVRTTGTTININMDNVDTIMPLINNTTFNAYPSSFTGDALNRVNFNCNNCIKKYEPLLGTPSPNYNSAYGGAATEARYGNLNDAMFFYNSNAFLGGTGSAVVFNVKGNYTTDKRGLILWGNGNQGKFIFDNVNFINTSDNPCIVLDISTAGAAYRDKYFMISNSTLLTLSGTGYTITTTASPVTIYVKNVDSNNTISPTITQTGGTVNVNSSLQEFFRYI